MTTPYEADIWVEETKKRIVPKRLDKRSTYHSKKYGKDGKEGFEGGNEAWRGQRGRSR